jgi:16S rRNA (guanine966-N2)-methyltransferase
MRVITGSARGRRLQTLEGDDVRPTTDRVKEAVFSILQPRLEGRRFLDLFAGSGQMGIEALSRGAAEAVFADQRREAIEVIRKNLVNTKLDKSAKVYQTDFRECLQQAGGFDIAYLDPPYRSGLLQRALPLTADKMKPTGMILCESPVGEDLPEQVGNFVRGRRYQYGKVAVTVYQYEGGESNENSDMSGQL